MIFSMILRSGNFQFRHLDLYHAGRKHIKVFCIILFYTRLFTGRLFVPLVTIESGSPRGKNEVFP